MRLRLPIPSHSDVLFAVADGLETTCSVLAAARDFADELYRIAEAQADGVPYKRRDTHPIGERELTNDPRYLAGRQPGREQVAVGGGLPVQRRPHLSVVPNTSAAGGGSA